VVQRRMDGYFEALERRDLDWILTFWADVDGFVFAAEGSLIAGYDAFAEQLRSAMEATASVNSIEKSNEHIYVSAKDAASYSLEFAGSMTAVSGDTVRSRGSWTYVFKRIDGEWRIVHCAGAHVYF